MNSGALPQRALFRTIASKTRLTYPSSLLLRQSHFRLISQQRTTLTSPKPATTNSMTTEPAAETVDLTFVEEPLGLRADQGYGYLQVDFGERIGPNDRYEILRKLGWGMNASVWLARDHKDDRYVAIKALKGMATDLHHRGFMQELDVMERLTELIQHFGQHPYCNILHSHFVQPGKPGDGEHLCLVMDVLVGDIESLQSESKAFPVSLAKLILRDALRGLSQLHASGGVHTDLKAANIMCCLPEATSEDKLRALLATDPSRRHPPEPSWEHPVEAAVSQPLPPPSLQRALSASFMISDFGSAQLAAHQVTSHITPDVLRAPESILQGPWDSKVDMWTYGCLVYEFLLGIPLFSRKHEMMDPDIYHLAQIIKFTGEEFPPSLLKSYKLGSQFFDEDTGYMSVTHKPVNPVHVSLLFRRNAEVLGISEHDIVGAIDLLSRCLRVNPADRPTAIQLARESAWLLELGDDF